MQGMMGAAKEMLTGHKGGPFTARGDAEALREALKGAGTDEKKVCDIVCNRDYDQIQMVRKEYANLYQRELAEDIKSDFSGVIQKALTGLVYSPTEFNASCVKKATKGVGTDEDVLIEHLCHRTNVEMENICMAYNRMYNKSLVDDLESDLSGDAKKFFVSLVKNSRKDMQPTSEQLKATCESLYNAGQGKMMGTDEKTFIGVLTTYHTNFLQALNAQYGQLYGDNLQAAVKKEMGGVVGKAMEALLVHHDEWYADLIHGAVKGVGTDEDRLVRIICSRRHVLSGIKDKFMQKYGKSLTSRIESDTSGDVQKVLTCITSHA